MPGAPRTAVLASCLSLLLCACASPEHSSTSNIDIPATWAGDDRAAMAVPSSLVGWWSRFDDPILTSLVAARICRTATRVHRDNDCYGGISVSSFRSDSDRALRRGSCLPSALLTARSSLATAPWMA